MKDRHFRPTDPRQAPDESGKSSFIHRVWSLYYDGFRSMTIGKTLWIIILVKLFVFFAILKLFFFPDLLNTRFDNDADRADHVRQELINRGR